MNINKTLTNILVATALTVAPVSTFAHTCEDSAKGTYFTNPDKTKGGFVESTAYVDSSNKNITIGENASICDYSIITDGKVLDQSKISGTSELNGGTLRGNSIMSGGINNGADFYGDSKQTEGKSKKNHKFNGTFTYSGQKLSGKYHFKARYTKEQREELKLQPIRELEAKLSELSSQIEEQETIESDNTEKYSTKLTELTEQSNEYKTKLAELTTKKQEKAEFLLEQEKAAELARQQAIELKKQQQIQANLLAKQKLEAELAKKRAEELAIKKAAEIAKQKVIELKRLEKKKLNELKIEFNQLTRDLNSVESDYKTSGVSTEVLSYIDKTTEYIEYQPLGGKFTASKLSTYPVKDFFDKNTCIIDTKIHRVSGMFAPKFGGTAVDVDIFERATHTDYKEKTHYDVVYNEYILYGAILDPKISKLGEFRSMQSNQRFRVWSAKGNDDNKSKDKVKTIGRTINKRIHLCRDNETLIKKAIKEKIKLN